MINPALLFLVFFGAAAGLAQGDPAGPGARDDRPNVILILADDLGIGMLGCYGQKIVKTPPSAEANRIKLNQGETGGWKAPVPLRARVF